MTMKSSRGQILPFTVLTLFVLTYFVGVNSQRWFTGIKKIEQQREADSVILIAATEQARALNAIASLNQALQTVLNRGTIVATAYVTLAACAASVIFTSSCLGPFQRLSEKIVPFIRKLNELGETLALYQDQIVKWAATSSKSVVEADNAFALLDAHNVLFAYPLPIRRYGVDRFKGASRDEQTFGQGGDLLKCKSTRYDSYAKFKAAVLGIATRWGTHDSAQVTYRSLSQGVEKAFLVKSKSELVLIEPRKFAREGSRTEVFAFNRAIVSQCQSFRDLLAKLNGGRLLPFRIPPPYVLEASFVEGRNRLALARANKVKGGIMDPILRMDPNVSIFHRDIWALSEAQLDGTDLMQMDFHASLSRTTLHDQLQQAVQSNRNRMRLTAGGFEPPPTFRPNEERMRRAP